MSRIQSIILLTIGSIAILQGIGLKFLIPLMTTGLSTVEILIISGVSAALFVPFVLEIIVNRKWLHFLPIALLIGLISGIISGYFWDCLLSNLLVGILSIICIYCSNLLYVKLHFKVVFCFLFLAIFTLIFNIVGHGLFHHEAIFYFQLAVITLKDYLLCGVFCAWVINKFYMPQMSFES